MNQAGQFVVGASNRINFHNTVDFIKTNSDKSVLLYNKYLKYILIKIKMFSWCVSSNKKSIKI